MAELSLDLLGGFVARCPDGRACALPTRKAEALLAFLALPAGRYHARDKLAGLLWGETADQQARQSLRQALAALRRMLRAAGAPELLVQGDSIALDPAAVRVDAALLSDAAASDDPAVLEAAAALYNGDFLDGLRVDEPLFDDWRLAERERLRELALSLLVRLHDQYAAVGARRADAIRTAQRILVIDPLREEAHRALMRLYLQDGRRAAALQQYQICVGILERELGADPEEETRALYRDLVAASGGQRADANGPIDPRAGQTPLIGRDREIEALLAALDAAGGGDARVVLLRGEAGMGKSRLLLELAGHAATRGCAAVIGHCHPTEQILPLQPWVDALRATGVLDRGDIAARLGDALATRLARVFPELRGPKGDPGPAVEDAAVLFDALIRLAGLAAERRTLVLLIEDLHWADGLSARFLAFLGRRLGSLPVLIVGSMRPEELVDAPVLAQAARELRADPRVVEINLAPLAQPLGLALARSVRSDLSAADAESISASAQGNPFVIVETVRALRERRGAAPALAEGIRDFVSERLDRLDEGARHIASVAAVIGRSFSFALAAGASGLPPRTVAERIEHLVRRRILATAGDTFEFCHDWFRLVAYERLLPQWRATLHLAVADAIEAGRPAGSDEHSGELAHHLLAAGKTERAIAHLIVVGELASRRYAMDEALRALDQAIGVAAALPDGLRDRHLLDLTLRKAFALSILGRQREIAALLDGEASRAAQVSDPLLVAEYHFRVGLTAFYLGDHLRCRPAAERSLAAAEASGNEEAIGKALHVLSLVCFETSSPEEGIAFARRAVPLLDKPATQHWYGLVHHDLALNCLILGDLDGTLDAAAREFAVGRASEWLRVQALAGYVKAWVLTLRGDLEAARAAAEASRTLAKDAMVGGLAAGALAHVLIERGEGAAAVPILTDLVRQSANSPVRTSEVRHKVLLAEALAQTGEIAAASAQADEALAMAGADGNRFTTGLALRAKARIADAQGQAADAIAGLGRAIETFDACGAQFEAARSRAALAALVAAGGRQDAAAVLVAEALAVFRAAGAGPRVEALEGLAAELHIDAEAATR